jgi:hypothetical protein
MNNEQEAALTLLGRSGGQATPDNLLDENWNLITRWILPKIDQPSPAPGIPHAFGLGDFNPTSR